MSEPDPTHSPSGMDLGYEVSSCGPSRQKVSRVLEQALCSVMGSLYIVHNLT